MVVKWNDSIMLININSRDIDKRSFKEQIAEGIDNDTEN